MLVFIKAFINMFFGTEQSRPTPVSVSTA